MDPASITGIGLAIVPLTIQSIKSLKSTVTHYKGRDKTLARLYHVLEDLNNILEALERAVASEASARALLEGPVNRCNLLCREFETAMQAFGGTSKMGFRDWTKMEFMKGDINEFMDRLAGYKATISVGLGTITMQTSKLSHKVLEEYNEMIQDTVYSLNINLQRLDGKMDLIIQGSRSASVSNKSVNLEDERVVTEQCLQICQDASSYIGSLADQEEFLKDQFVSAPFAGRQELFEAQLLTRRALNESRDSIAQTVGRLQERLESMTTNDTSKSDLGYQQLQGDLRTSKQCLELCKKASEQVANQKVYTVGEMVADSDSDQVVITTLADLFDVKKASSTNGSAQWIGSLSEETAQQISKDRYGSRFGAVVTSGTSNIVSTMPLTTNTREVNSTLAARPGKAGQSTAREAVQRRPSPNEMRKRAAENGDEKEER
ncbi:uncharacterized protein FIESC28_10064 [Fusarium coffeatum]|uniref:Azaphilone pigments biosynthesis cluster protein L N-terminal domain-containing protein n=1 Tax=Fusarium coffeatum TaxID=231269 RepID=A0A366QVD6_9HYPO|nr:uncharacterized protein FIESC28_10064 [Fusarium coffeatum]RBR08884.1 hypothetical protein FIESC28_10064 [Fusarium coffeatum]